MTARVISTRHAADHEHAAPLIEEISVSALATGASKHPGSRQGDHMRFIHLFLVG
jgi:hypothetical protein